MRVVKEDPGMKKYNNTYMKLTMVFSFVQYVSTYILINGVLPKIIEISYSSILFP